MSDTQKQIAALQKQIASLEKKVSSFEKTSKSAKPKVAREPSAYNRFMSSEGSKIRKKNPDWKQPDVMREVARLWREKK